MKITKQYYIKNMYWGWFIGALFLYSCLEYELKYESLILLISIAGIVLYPLAKWGIECFFLQFTTREFWNRGLFLDTAGKAGGLALYSFIVFLLSIPITMIFILFVLVKRFFL
ncbi:colicin transporter [Proteus penneri]|uniref:colicin E1 family microcin immunity protein n=1 Tax=Proteus penneri TaxID=102862 RepID=UPI002097A3D7|nr:colicin E1 family microcin immunity protein [Proteus penneri]MCO8049898.1 colicin transporter [Proteus penneri]